mmetsp:Transcript_5464/g.8077  ORF Transcript_5464/g.8077 Transcript_5464/m.8077 type:complete len:1386 (-) Transcript_5464:101-4258(-)
MSKFMESKADAENPAHPPPPRGLPYSPFDRASLWSFLSFSFVGPLLERGKEYPLRDEDLDALSEFDTAKEVTDNLEAAWKDEIKKNPKNPSFWKAMYYSESNFFYVWLSGIYAFGESATRVSQPVVMGFLIKWLSNGGSKSNGYGEGLQWAFVLIAIGFAQALIHHQLYFYTMRGGWRTKTAAKGLIQRKLLKLPINVGMASNAIINLVSNDVIRFDQFSLRMHFGWTAPLEVITVFFIIWNQIGILPAVAGTGVLVITLPIQIYFGRRFAKQRKITTRITDQRVRKTAEVFQGISTVKAYCWEEPLIEEIGQLRQKERASIFVSQRMKAYNITFYLVTPALASLATFSVFWAQGEELEVAQVFSTLALIQILRVSIGKQFAGFIEAFPECLVAASRVRKFLLQGEKSLVSETKGFGSRTNDKSVSMGSLSLSRNVSRHSLGAGPAGDNGSLVELKAAGSSVIGDNAAGSSVIGENVDNNRLKLAGTKLTLDLRGVSYAFPKLDDGKKKKKDEKTPTYRSLAVSDLNIQLSLGELLVVLGPVGSGKTSLLRGILGELPQVSGVSQISDTLSLCAQEGWIMATNLQSNILFGLPMEAKRYQKVLTVCGLQPDLKQLPDGDMTQLGERGVNLSGGQKARVALARATYSKGKLCLLDDPLSAVDPHVMTQLFEQCIMGTLVREEKRSVILCTHHSHYAMRAHKLLVLDDRGNPQFFGKPGECPKNLLDVSTKKKTHGEAKKPEKGKIERRKPKKNMDASHKSHKEKGGKKTTTFIKKEERATGEVSWSTYGRYASLAGLPIAITSLALFAVAQATMLMSEFWLKIWAEQDQDEQRNPRNLYIFIALIGVLCVIATIRSVLFYDVNLRAASQLHDLAFLSVLRSPMLFFHTNPLGRILNKFSSDLGQIDELLPVTLFDVLQLSFTSLAAFIVVCIAIPWIAILSIPLVVMFFLIRKKFLYSSRELKRLESINKSPIFAAFTAQLRGLITIRAFGSEPRLRKEFLKSLDKHGIAWFSWLLCNRWIGFRLDMLSFSVLVCASLGAVATNESIDPGLAGIALTYAIMLSGGFQYLVRQSAKAETTMTSVERMQHYTSLENEGSWDDSKGAPKYSKDTWPSKGEIVASDLSCRYREDLPTVLKQISFRFPGGSRVGVVGRTGSGKSSLLNALLRLNQVCGGSIEIDGVDVLKLGLHSLRKNVAWIPQEPHLFSGDLRHNLDPFRKSTDDQIWQALRAVQLDEAVKRMPGELEAEITDGGANLSVGQRQLLSLARAILRNCRVVVMDEATANIDLSTDRRIQQAISKEKALRDSTILMIAHRLRTVASCDIVLVLDGGKVMEIGPPRTLAEQKNGTFASMVRASGMSLDELGKKDISATDLKYEAERDEKDMKV